MDRDRALQQRRDGLTQQLIYVSILAALLATRSWDRWSLDSRPQPARSAPAPR